MIKYLLLISWLTYTVSGCSSNKESMLCTKWTLVKSVDPYQGGTVNERDDSNWKHIEFMDNGEYIEQDPWNMVKGKWALNKDQSKLAMTEMVRNEKQVGAASTPDDFRYTIFELTKMEMILGIQGRHGIVKYHYKKSPGI